MSSAGSQFLNRPVNDTFGMMHMVPIQKVISVSVNSTIPAHLWFIARWCPTTCIWLKQIGFRQNKNGADAWRFPLWIFQLRHRGHKYHLIAKQAMKLPRSPIRQTMHCCFSIDLRFPKVLYWAWFFWKERNFAFNNCLSCKILISDRSFTERT